MSEEIDYEVHWEQFRESYSYQPTVRHRMRFILNMLDGSEINDTSFIFDYGCGMGACLEHVKSRYRLEGRQLGGCDVSKRGVEIARRKIDSPHLYDEAFPSMPLPCHAIICSEVIEHTRDYEKILEWIIENLRPGGYLALSTPGGTMDPPDEFYGHIQHFNLEDLVDLMKALGFHIVQSRSWGYPLFTLQKYITKRYFDSVRASFMETNLSLKKKIIYNSAYYAYFLHDRINSGPQIFIHARKPS